MTREQLTNEVFSDEALLSAAYLCSFEDFYSVVLDLLGDVTEDVAYAVYKDGSI